ncbi:transcriptional regulator [Leptospira tipperaryensis]|uniref:Transcriptional regulator n=1 Tax=Leptospira tipperaryensis TaxID=2564040 RepID=A0A1D7UU87_9LEPT|nr:TetR family transcriptional regulator [Leptospira tipperaryensis]AOP33111.1 transcriptional regulator [Leptospira tipperaryensis]
MEKKRARKPEEKEVRKQSIVNALKELLLKERFPLPSSNDIAQAAQVTKGVIYFYFKTREEIFLTLYLQEANHFFEKLDRVLLQDSYSIEKVKKTILAQFTENEIFMFLGLIVPGILESNVDPEFLYSFKKATADGMDQIAKSWMKKEKELTLTKARKFILRFFFLALMLWQHNHPTESAQKAFAGKKLWLAEGDFKQELSESFDWLWQGLMRDSSPKRS